MPRLVVPAFLDPSNTGASIQQSASRFVNTYLHSVSPGHAKSQVSRLLTPGLHPFCTFYDGPIRGLLDINGRVFAVGGEIYAEVFDNGTLGDPFTVTDDNQPASMASNGSAGHQNIIASGGDGYIHDLNTDVFTDITGTPGFPDPCRMVDFMDGYFLALKGGGSRSFSWSGPENGLSWSTLDVAERSEASDNLAALIRNHREIWLLGGSTSEVWWNTGSSTNTFAPLQGVFIEHGALGPFTVQRCDNALIWQSLDAQGKGMVWRSDGYIPKRISTDAVEVALNRASAQTDARAWTYQMNGHVFYVLILPREETSWVYDVNMDRWQEWATWNPTTVQWMPHVAGNHVFSFDKHLVGSRFDSTIYEMSADFYDEQITGL